MGVGQSTLGTPYQTGCCAVLIESAHSRDNVSERPVIGHDPLESATSLLCVADAFVQISQCVPQAKMMLACHLGAHRTLLEQADSASQVVSICKRAGHHNAAFGNGRCVGMIMTKFVPQPFDCSMLSKSTMGVCPNRVLIGRTRQGGNCFKLDDRF